MTRFDYLFGDLSATTDPRGNTTSFFVDGGGRLVSESDPLGSRSRSEYSSH